MDVLLFWTFVVDFLDPISVFQEAPPFTAAMAAARRFSLASFVSRTLCFPLFCAVVMTWGRRHSWAVGNYGPPRLATSSQASRMATSIAAPAHYRAHGAVSRSRAAPRVALDVAASVACTVITARRSEDLKRDVRAVFASIHL